MASDKDMLHFLICSNCQGSGFSAEQKCQVCHGYGVISFVDENVLYWGKKITQNDLVIYKIERLISFISRFIFVLIGLVGILSLIYAFYLMDFSLAIILSPEFWLAQNTFLAIFWLSLFFDLYFFYFYSLAVEKKVQVIAKKYRSGDDFSHLVPPPLDWQQVKNLKHKNQIDISLAFNDQAHKVIEKSFDLALKLNAQEVAPIHLILSSLLNSNRAENLFLRLGVDLNDLVDKLSRVAAKYSQGQNNTVFGSQAKKALIKAYFQAYLKHQTEVDTLLILQEAIKKDESIKEVLDDLGINISQIENVVMWFQVRNMLQQKYALYRSSSRLKSKTGIDRAMTALQTPFLNQFSEDLTYLAKMGHLNISIDRDSEYAEIFRILEGSSVKAVILVGESGVGKTAIIEGLAQKMIADDVPEFMQDKRLVSLSISRLLAGASISDAQQRLLICLSEIAQAGNIILYIDNLHDILAISEGATLAEVLAEALNKNLFTLIADSSLINYKRYVETSNIANIIKKIEIKEPDINGAIQIVEASSIFIEGKNNVYLNYEAVEKAVTLTDRYVHDKFLPYKAISLLEEVAVWARRTKGANAVVSGNDVATLLSEKISMPVSQVTASESEKLVNLEQIIHERMVDQHEAVTAVANSLRRARAELRDASRPIANLLFLGPTGVGKTELAKTIAEVYFGNEENMIRLDMSEYQEKDSVNRLLGAPVGFSGNQIGGVLTEAVRLKPYSIVLLDELEKAHPDILNLFLQVMDDGRLTDVTGRTIDFTNTVLIATSNATTGFIQDKLNVGISTEEIKRQLLESELKKHFRPEFINRFDNVIIFKPLGFEEIVQITKLMLKKVIKSMEVKNINFQITDEAIQELAQTGFDPQYGARPLRRAIQEHVDNALAQFLLTGKISRRDVVILDKGGVIRVEKAQKL
jgi:ATP-dependent Clp protease ATP-binding subunit ClpC